MKLYGNLIDGCYLALASMVGAAAGSVLIYPLLEMFVTADRPTMVPTYELAIALGVVAGAIAWKLIAAWRIAVPTNSH